MSVPAAARVKITSAKSYNHLVFYRTRVSPNTALFKNSRKNYCALHEENTVRRVSSTHSLLIFNWSKYSHMEF